LWKLAVPARADHPYLVRKSVAPVVTLRELPAPEIAKRIGYQPQSDGKPLTGRVLIVPVCVGVDQNISTIEFIDEAGRKSAAAGGAKAAGFWTTQRRPEGDGKGLTLYLCEGVATTLSVFTTTDKPSFAALSCGTLEPAALTLRKQYPQARIVICG